MYDIGSIINATIPPKTISMEFFLVTQITIYILFSPYPLCLSDADRIVVGFYGQKKEFMV